MKDKQFYLISVLSLAMVVGLAILSLFFESFNLLFNVLLTVIGLVGGILTSLYFAKQQERENLGKFASLAYRLSIDIHDSLTDTISSIEQSRAGLNSKSNRIYTVRLEEIEKKLGIIRKFALTANNNWRHLLPPEELHELKQKETTVALMPLSERHQVRIREQRVPLQNSPK